MKKHPSNKVNRTKVFQDDNYDIYYKKEPNPNIPLELLAISVHALDQVKEHFAPQSWDEGINFFVTELNKRLSTSEKIITPKNKIITP